MSKTIEEIKEQYAKELGYSKWVNIGYDANSEKRNNEVAKRYAQSQTQELQEQDAELVEMLEDMETAWQSLPYGHNSVRDTQNWITNSLHPQILRMREWISKNKTSHLKSNTNGSI